MLKLGRYWLWKTVSSHFICQYDLCCCIVWPSFVFDCFVNNLQEFFGQMDYRPPWQKIARTPMFRGSFRYSWFTHLSSFKCEQMAISSLGSRRLEVMGTRKNERERRRHARGCLPRARPFSFAHYYFQAPATQARGLDPSSVLIHRLFWLILMWEFRSVYERVNPI